MILNSIITRKIRRYFIDFNILLITIKDTRPELKKTSRVWNILSISTLPKYFGINFMP